MFFESPSEIRDIASRIGTGIFVVPRSVNIKINNAIVLQPENKSAITIEQVRNVMGRLGVKQVKDQFVLIRPAEKLSLEAANALLKNLEEPKNKIHFVLVTDAPSQILPTVLSRAALYILREDFRVDSAILADDKVKELAKELLTAKGAELVDVAEKIAKKKDGSRTHALEVLGVAIEMLYKTYFLTEKEVFVAKLPKFLQAYDAISRNGHVKLQIVANL